MEKNIHKTSLFPLHTILSTLVRCTLFLYGIKSLTNVAIRLDIISIMHSSSASSDTTLIFLLKRPNMYARTPIPNHVHALYASLQVPYFLDYKSHLKAATYNRKNGICLTQVHF